MTYIVVCPKCNRNSTFNVIPVHRGAPNIKITIDGFFVPVKCGKCDETSFYPLA